VTRDEALLRLRATLAARPADRRLGGRHGALGAQYVCDRAIGVVGFYGASSMERLPVEAAIVENARRFEQLSFTPR
jgi:hypothetical protein